MCVHVFCFSPHRHLLFTLIFHTFSGIISSIGKEMAGAIAAAMDSLAKPVVNDALTTVSPATSTQGTATALLVSMVTTVTWTVAVLAQVVSVKEALELVWVVAREDTMAHTATWLVVCTAEKILVTRRMNTALQDVNRVTMATCVIVHACQIAMVMCVTSQAESVPMDVWWASTGRVQCQFD